MAVQKIRPDLDIGHTIRKLRLQNHLSQDDVVAQLQLMGLAISRSTYAKIETNRMNVRVSELVGLQRIFGVEFNAFFAELSIADD